MSQATNPHPSLLQCRCAIEATGVSRRNAAEICGTLTNEQVDAVLSGMSVYDAIAATAPRVETETEQPKPSKKK